MNNNFYKTNIESKMKCLQAEHYKVLDILYKDACNKGVIKDYKFDLHLCQSMLYTKLEEMFGELGCKVLQVCLGDLQGYGFIINTMRNPYKESEFAITELGVKCIEYKNTGALKD